MAETPRYRLNEVKELIRRYREGEATIWFSARARSIICTLTALACDLHRAEEVILAGIETLESEDFALRTLQWDMVCDVYGLECYEGHNWYIKFAVVEEDNASLLDQISFHPLEKDLKVADGRHLHATFVPADKKGE